MYFRQFAVGMLTASALMAIWTYMATGSFWKSLAWAVLTLFVLQALYFVLALRLTYKRAAESAGCSGNSVELIEGFWRWLVRVCENGRETLHEFGQEHNAIAFAEAQCKRLGLATQPPRRRKSLKFPGFIKALIR